VRRVEGRGGKRRLGRVGRGGKRTEGGERTGEDGGREWSSSFATS